MNATIYYERGQVVKILPEPHKPYYEAREIINAATRIVSDGVLYDLTDRDSIYSIEIPEYTYSHDNPNAQNLGVTGYLEYVLRMHSGLLWNAGDYRLSMVCLGKACQLMLYSTIGWQRKDYYRIVDDYIRLGRFKKAEEWKKWIEENTTAPTDYSILAFNRTLENCKFLGTDLVQVGDSESCCDVCAKYRKRIFSLSGKDRKFPKFPDDFHFECGLSVSPFIYKVMSPSFKCLSCVMYSRRPFKDDRSKQEKENYKKRMEIIEREKYSMPEPNLAHIIYYRFKPLFPDIFPKTVGAFSRMRNANSANYKKIISAVENAGYKIPSSIEEVAAWDAENNN